MIDGQGKAVESPQRRILRITAVWLLAAGFLAAGAAAADDQPSNAPSDAQRQQLLAEQDRLEVKARQLQAAGKKIEAIAVVREMITLERKLFGDIHEELAGSFDWMATLYRELDDFSNSQMAWSEVIRIRSELLGKDHWKVADARLALEDVKLLARLNPRQRRRLREADNLQRQALNLYRQGKYQKALQPTARLLEIRKRILGEEHLSYATSLDGLAGLYHRMGEYSRAEPLLLQAREIRKKVMGEAPYYYAQSLNNLALLYDSMGKYTKAEPLYLQARQIRREVLGEEHPDYAQSLHNLALLYENMGEYTKAEPLCLQARDILKKALGEENPYYAKILNNLAALYASMGEYTKAEPLFLQTRKIYKKLVGEEHPHYARSLGGLANLYANMGEYSKAEPLCLQAREIRKRVLGEEHPEYARSLDSLANLYESMGEYSKAEPLCLQAREIRKKVVGEEHPDYAKSLHNLALLYESMGAYARAEQLFLQTREIWEKVLGEEHPSYATSLNNLANLYGKMGEYTKAEPLYLDARDIWKKVLGEEHPSYAKNLNSLATLYESMGEYARAEPLYLQAREILKKVLGKEHPSYATSLNNLAGLYNIMGEYSKAEPLFLQTRGITKRVFGEENPDYAQSLGNLAGLYLTMGDYSKAEPLFLQERHICKKVLGEEHPDYAASLNNLAFLYKTIGEFTKAESLLRQSLEVKLQIAQRTLPVLPEAAALAYLAKQQIGRDPLLSVLRKLPEEERGDVFSSVWATRALATRMLAERRRLTAGSPKAEVVQKKLGGVRGQLAQLTLATPKPAQVEARRRQLSELNEQKESLERELAALSEPFRRSMEVRDAQVADLVGVLPHDSAVVDVIRAAVWNPPPEGKGRLRREWQYEAFVVRPADNEAGYTARWVHLGRAEPIEQAVRTWLHQIRSGRGGAAQRGRSPSVQLRELLWERIEPHLGDCSTLYLIPDGLLCYLPWSALPGRNPATVLLEDYALATAVSGQQLYALLSEPASKTKGLLVVGGVDYDSRGSETTTPLLASTGDRVTHRGPAREADQAVNWPFLQGTLAESAAIQEIWNHNAPSQLLQTSSANEAMLREHLPGSRYVHLATHGFFADEKFRSMFRLSEEQERLYGSQRDLASARRATVTARNPLILSGVVLAGANLPPLTNELGIPTGDDGILTAEEVVNLNLHGTELVVLSACETGLGRTGGGEGVFGLQRAFHLAGARNVLASLWKVDDQATAAQMKLFYQKLWQEQKPPLQALREAQLYIYRNPEQISELARTRGLGDITRLATKGKLSQDEKAPVRHWAAFVLSGPGT
jgi:CHAT domain-containing protein